MDRGVAALIRNFFFFCGRERTYRLVLHARKDDVEHLRERGLGGGLVDEVLAGQVDVVAGAHGLQDGALVDFYVLGGDGRQQGLAERVSARSAVCKEGALTSVSG